MNKVTYYGEFGDIIEINATEIQCGDTPKHSGLLIGLDGNITDGDGNINIVLSPVVAKCVAKALLEFAEEADNENYKRLTNKYQD
jgi:hypothetical protein